MKVCIHRGTQEESALLRSQAEFALQMSGNLPEKRALTLPSFAASEASIVAIFAVRITDGTGRPAMTRLPTVTSPGQPRLSGAGDHHDPQQAVRRLDATG